MFLVAACVPPVPVAPAAEEGVCGPNVSESDTDADGTVDQTCTTSFDGLVATEVCEGAAPARNVSTYREDWLLESLVSDDGDDDVVDFSLRHAYDAQARLAESAWDDDGDEVVDARDRWAYVALERSLDTDHGDDGTVDERVRQVTDDAGRILSIEFDAGADGAVDWREDCAYAGAYATCTDGSYVRTLTLDERGNELLIERDDEIDGEIDWARARTYDDRDRPLTEEVVEAGARTSRTAWFYGC